MNTHTAAGKRKTINIMLRQPFTQSSSAEAALIAECIEEIKRLDGHIAPLHFLGGAEAQSQASFREDFERKVGAAFSPRNFRDYRLALLGSADAFINLRTGMSESTAFEIAYNLCAERPVPMFFAVWRNAPIRTTLIRDLQEIADVSYAEFDAPRELRTPLWEFLVRIARQRDDPPRAAHAGRRPAVQGGGLRPVCVAANVPTGVLVLENGETFWGQGMGAEGERRGELCFNTAMTGYQEILSDPSYAGQVVAFPHIGNTGVNAKDMESMRPQVQGCVMRAPVSAPSSHRAAGGLQPWLRRHGIVGICDVDTREVTRLLRDRGAQRCVVAHDPRGAFDLEALRQAAAGCESLTGKDLASRASTSRPRTLRSLASARRTRQRPNVVVVDYGVKGNIVEALSRRGAEVVVMPAKSTSKAILEHRPDGVVLSNGPGDPTAVAPYTMPVIETLMSREVPLFGICLGHQLLGLALGAKVHKMHFGHHGANHPVLDRRRGRVLITSQNHGFVVDGASLPDGARVTHVSLFDGTLAGFEMRTRPIMSVQFHPEASPGPHDASGLFDRFMARMRKDAAQADRAGAEARAAA